MPPRMIRPRPVFGSAGPVRCRTCVGAEPIDPAVLQASLEAGTQVLTATNTLLQAHANKVAARQQPAHRRKKAPVVVAPPPKPRKTPWVPVAVAGGLILLAVLTRKPKKVT